MERDEAMERAAADYFGEEWELYATGATLSRQISFAHWESGFKTGYLAAQESPEAQPTVADANHKAVQILNTLALMRSMIESGESFTASSTEAYRNALDLVGEFSKLQHRPEAQEVDERAWTNFESAEDDTWQADCGFTFILNDGERPTESKMLFCCCVASDWSRTFVKTTTTTISAWMER